MITKRHLRDLRNSATIELQTGEVAPRRSLASAWAIRPASARRSPSRPGARCAQHRPRLHGRRRSRRAGRGRGGRVAVRARRRRRRGRRGSSPRRCRCSTCRCRRRSSPAAPTRPTRAAVVRWIETAVGLALAGEVGGVVTAPIAKAPLYEAGFAFPGHTEFIGELTAAAPLRRRARAGDDARRAGTCASPSSPSTSRWPEVPALLTHRDDRQRRPGHRPGAARATSASRAPRLAVAGLNPHAGEGGALGREEIEIVAPAVARAARPRRRLHAARCPPTACSTTRPAAAYDAALCLYHDQALIPVKMLDFWGGVNLTLGLPIVRTSPDHGAALRHRRPRPRPRPTA